MTAIERQQRVMMKHADNDGLVKHAVARERIVDPVLFARHILRDDPWETQVEIFRALEKPRARVAVKGCHASSKTYGAAEFVLWFITRYKDAIAVTTAPTDRQVEKVMWGEIHKAMARSRFPYPKANLTELKMDTGNYAIGFSTSKGEQAVRFQGYHANHLLFVIDEAPGVPPEVLQAIEGAAAGGDVRVLMLGNPTIPSGSFHDAFTANRTSWQCFTIDAYDTPNFAKLREAAGKDKEVITELLKTLPEDSPVIEHSPRDYLARPPWARSILNQLGEKSPIWQARVRAQFPEQAEDSLISLKWLDASSDREAVDDGGRVTVGIDVAGPGEDETVVCIRNRKAILALRAWPNQDPRGEVAAFVGPYRARIEEMNIDAAGIGHYFGKHFEDLGYPVNYVNVGEAPMDSEHYYLLKAELYWGLRQRFEDGDVDGLTDETAISQLASIRYKHNARGQVVIESKDDARKRGVKSPDRAEAIMLAFAERTPGIMRYYQEQSEAALAARAQKESPTPPTVEAEPEQDDMTKIYEAELKRLREGGE